MIAGCYVLHLYCDGPCRETPFWNRTCCARGPAEYTANTEGGAKRQARKDGWIFKKGKPYGTMCYCSKSCAKGDKS